MGMSIRASRLFPKMIYALTTRVARLITHTIVLLYNPKDRSILNNNITEAT